MSTLINKAISETQAIDCVAIAEEAGLGIGVALLLQQQKSADMDALMSLTHDTKFNMDTNEYIEVIKDIGFVEVFSEKFERVRYDYGHKEDMCFAFYKEPGILLWMDTFGKQRNSAHVYFNFKPTNQDKRTLWQQIPPITSGRFDTIDGQSIHSGYFDAREGVRYTLKQFESKGMFLNPWVSEQLVQLTTGEDYGSDDLPWQQKSKMAGDASKRRYNALPEYVKKAIPESCFR